MKNRITKLLIIALLAFAISPLLTSCKSSSLVSVTRTVNPLNIVYSGPVKINGADVIADFEDRSQQMDELYGAGPDKISQTYIVFDKGLKFHILDDYSLLSDEKSVNATTLGAEEIKQASQGKSIILPYDLYFPDGKKKLNPKNIRLSY